MYTNSILIVYVCISQVRRVTLICKRISMQKAAAKGTVTIDALPATSKISEDTRECPNVAPARMRCRWISGEYIQFVV